jgi:23S rRNA (cytidine1920-2'-O)/16S rRNA (cytidine1409-2'-O)-methyltransferase
MDVSFISVKLIMPSLIACLAEKSDFVCLIKPQFEVGKGGLGKGGIVKDEKLRRRAVEDVIFFAGSVGFKHIGLIESPIKGGDGNIEYLAHFRKG